MGGTTAKFCVIEDGEPLVAHEFEVDRVYRFKRGSGLPVKVPVIDMIEIGAGGGSIARVDASACSRSGPTRPAPIPGPVCYGRGGTEPTVTDADLVLGYLDPAFFLGGRMALDSTPHARAIEERVASHARTLDRGGRLGDPHDREREHGQRRARPRLERGKDPRSAAALRVRRRRPGARDRLARALGSPVVIAPLGAGIMSTVGFLSAPARVRLRALLAQRRSTRSTGERADAILARDGSARATTLLGESGVPTDEVESHALRRHALRRPGPRDTRVPLPAGELARRGATLARASSASTRGSTAARGPRVRVEAIYLAGHLVGPAAGPRAAYGERPGGDSRRRKGDAPRLLPGARRLHRDTRVRSLRARRRLRASPGPRSSKSASRPLVVGAGRMRRCRRPNWNLDRGAAA